MIQPDDLPTWNEQRIIDLECELAELRDFAQWLTGCGYDFCQHEYFIKNRHLLSTALEQTKDAKLLHTKKQTVYIFHK